MNLRHLVAAFVLGLIGCLVWYLLERFIFPSNWHIFARWTEYISARMDRDIFGGILSAILCVLVVAVIFAVAVSCVLNVIIAIVWFFVILARHIGFLPSAGPIIDEIRSLDRFDEEMQDIRRKKQKNRTGDSDSTDSDGSAGAS